MKNNINFKKAFLIALIASLGISALTGIFAFLFGSFGEFEEKVLSTTILIAGYSLTGLCSAFLYEKKKYLPLSYIGIAVAVIGFIVTLLGFWEIIEFDETIGKIVVTFIVASISLSQVSLLLLIKYDKAWVNKALIATIVFISIVALMLLYVIFNDMEVENEFFFRLLGTFAILDVLGTITTPILNKITTMK